MMIILVAVLSILLLFYYSKYRGTLKDITMITEKIVERSTGSEQPITYVTEKKEIQQLLKEINYFIAYHREMDKERKQLDRGMKNTVTNLSHDLKTPLTVISGYAEITRKTSDTITKEELLHYLAKIETQSTKLVQTIDNYFDLNKLNGGEMQIERVAVDVSEVLREELLSYYLEIEQANVDLTVDIASEETIILGNVHSLRRIFSNLLSNAVRYGKDGGVLIVKSWRTIDTVCIEISDQGKGFLEENQSKIFDRLAMFEDAKDKNYQGSGLGLSITKKLVEQLGGNISLYSKPCVRTTFTLTFPLQVTENE